MLISINVFANENDLYLNLGITGSLSSNTSEYFTGSKYGLGYNLNPSFAVELTNEHLGDDFNGNDIKLQSFGLWGVYNHSLGNVNNTPVHFMGKLGLLHSKAISHINIPVHGIMTKIVDNKETINGMGYSLGLSFGVNDNVDLYVDYTKRHLDGNSYNSKISTIGTGVKFKF